LGCEVTGIEGTGIHASLRDACIYFAPYRHWNAGLNSSVATRRVHLLRTLPALKCQPKFIRRYATRTSSSHLTGIEMPA